MSDGVFLTLLTGGVTLITAAIAGLITKVISVGETVAKLDAQVSTLIAEVASVRVTLGNFTAVPVRNAKRRK